MTIGDRLREWRVHRGDTQDEFAALIGKHVGMVRKWEGGTAMPGGDALVSIAGTGVNLHWLLTGDGSMNAAMAPADPPAGLRLVASAGDSVPAPAGAVDIPRLQEVIAGVEDGLVAINKQLAPAVYAEVVALCYQLASMPGFGQDQIRSVIKLAA